MLFLLWSLHVGPQRFLVDNLWETPHALRTLMSGSEMQKYRMSSWYIMFLQCCEGDQQGLPNPRRLSGNLRSNFPIPISYVSTYDISGCDCNLDFNRISRFEGQDMSWQSSIHGPKVPAGKGVKMITAMALRKISELKKS